ncbi:hypothetical protein QYE76_024465 [Lolium multiflorum]|uniref:Gag-pol polyprotein n=1 Tax=Lolium multiflorum TaxID=4521 RepID=A0AAD8VW38_LOLMU|nr:hypothetical protein QYE76_024465 [Lolium multiflorum]
MKRPPEMILSGRVPEAISDPEMGLACGVSEGFRDVALRPGLTMEALAGLRAGQRRHEAHAVGRAAVGQPSASFCGHCVHCFLFSARKLLQKIGPLFLEKEKLKSNGSNFTDWFRHVRIFLNGGNLQYVLDAPLGDPPAETETDEVKNVYETRKTRYSQVQCAILCSLEADLQKRFEHHDPHELINELKTIFETHAAVECYEASKHFFSCMMEEGSSVSEHMLAMTGHAKKLNDLGIVIPNRLGINRVLQSLPPSYKNFVMNYNMQNMNKELPELFSMLKSAEIEIKKEHQVLMVNKTTSFKKQSKGKFKKGGKKAATPPVKPKGPKPDAECYYCKEKGHWKRNCSKYLADLKSGLVKKKKKEGISDIHELKNKRRLLKDEVTMRVGNGSKVDVIAVGTLPLHLPSGLVLSLNNCYFVPALSMNIISGSCLMQDGYSFKSENNGCSIFMNNIFYGRAPQKNGLFLLDLDSSDTHIHNIDAKRIKLNDNSTYMWHCRLGHIGVKRMKKLHTDGLLESLDFESLDRCEACLMGKMTKTPFSGIMERATDLLEIIHTDVCGPMSVASRGGYRYVLTFTDDLSRYGYIYFMKHKSETFEKFKEFQSEVENQRNKKIKFLRSDRGGEYLSYEFGMHLKKCGILSQLTPREHHNETTAAFTLNRAPSKSVEMTPYELWFNKKPKMSFLKVWGCEAYVKKLQPDKLEPKAEKCVFIGYPKETIGYFYHRSEGKIFVAKNGTFLEKEFLTKEVTRRKVELDEIDESSLIDQSSAVPENVPVPPTSSTEEANDDDHETSNEIATEPRRSTRERATPDWYDPCLNVMIVDNNDEDPATYEEAMMSPDSNKWQEAMKSEMGSMYDNKVWTLVDLPDSRKAVENKWIFKRKTDADGNITVYKARLVAKGFRQIQGVDYDETFSPVAKLKSVRILLAIAAFFDYEIWQMDVKTAFLNGDIEEELYMVRVYIEWCCSKLGKLEAVHGGEVINRIEYIAASRLHQKRKRTPDDAEELLARIGRNHDDWSTPEPTPTPILKKRGMIKLNDEDMREAKKSLKEKDNDKNDASDKEEVEEEPEKHAKNKKYTKEDFIAKKHGLLDDFLVLIGNVGLTAYMEDERDQYYMLTKTFVESFQFNNKHFQPSVTFRIYDDPITMKLKDFCTALDIAPVGTAKRIESNPKELLELYRGITNDDCRTIQRGKIRNIQLPAIKYFAYYLATSILGRENTGNISSYHIAFLIDALTGEAPYHLGALVARRLSNKGPIYGGIIASRILAHLELPLDPTDVKITPIRLDIAAMKSHQFVTADSSLDNIVYRMLFADGEEREVPLPQPDLFSIHREPWSRSKEEVDEQLNIQGFHQQHDSEDAEPSYDYTVTYPGASSSTYPDPSSSYYGGATSWAPWD